MWNLYHISNQGKSLFSSLWGAFKTCLFWMLHIINKCMVLYQDYAENVQFAPLGLIDMYNSAGAIEALNFTNHYSECIIKVKMRGCGHFGAYSSIKPKYCTVDTKAEEISYDVKNGFLNFNLSPSSQNESSLREIVIGYWHFQKLFAFPFALFLKWEQVKENCEIEVICSSHGLERFALKKRDVCCVCTIVVIHFSSSGALSEFCPLPW